METITIKDIARICGVGVSTVSRALNDHPDINPETRQKVMEVVEQYGFVPNNSARNLKITDSKTIAVLVKGISNPFFVKMIKIMEQEIISRHFTLELRHVDESVDEVEVACELVKEKKLQGIVFLGGRFNHSREKLKRVGVPIVLSTISGREEFAGLCSSIAVDDVAESKKIVDYLCDMGHKDIAIIGASDEDSSIGKLRNAGYEKALSEHGIKIRPELIFPMDNTIDTYTMENGYAVMKRILESGVSFSAVYAISDTLAIGACRALYEAGISVPENVSIAGFDGIDAGAFFCPSLTTIRQPFEKMAVETIRQLFYVIDGGESYRTKFFDGELYEGESVKKIN